MLKMPDVFVNSSRLYMPNNIHYLILLYIGTLFFLYLVLLAIFGDISTGLGWKRWGLFVLIFTPLLLIVFISQKSGLIYALGVFLASIPFIDLFTKKGFLPSVSLDLLIYCFALLSLFKLPKKNAAIKGHFALLLIAIVCLFNLFRTIDPITAIIFLMGMLSFYFIVYVIYPRLDFNDGFILIKSFIFGNLLFCLILFTTYDWGSGSRLGVSIGLNANSIGILFAFTVLSILFLSYLREAKPWHYAFLVLCFVGLLASGSRTSIAIVVLGAFIFLVLEKKFKTLLLASLVVALFIISFNLKEVIQNQSIGNNIVKGFDEVVLYRRGSMYYASRQGENLLHLMSAMRYQIYTRGLEVFTENWLIGVGLGNFQEIVRVWKYDDSRLMVAHSLFLQYGVEMGVLGLVSVIIWFFVLLKDAFIKKKSLIFSLICIFLGIGIVSGNFMHAEYGVFALLVFLLQPYLTHLNMLRQSDMVEKTD